MTLLALAAILSATAAPPPAAAPGPRPLAVPASARWQHALTGLILPPVLAGLHRESVTDFGTKELDVDATYRAVDDGITLSVFIFRSPIDSPAIWFDRARFAIARHAAGSPPRTAPFHQGLIAIFDRPSDGFASEGVAVLSTGDWQVKLRTSARSLSGPALEAMLEQVFAGIGWPPGMAALAPAVETPPCEKPLKLHRAQALRPDGATLLMSFLTSSPAADTPYCRDPDAGDLAIYRPLGTRDRYIVPLGDSGRALIASPAIVLPGRGDPDTAVVRLLDLDRTVFRAYYNRLPLPTQIAAPPR